MTFFNCFGNDFVTNAATYPPARSRFGSFNIFSLTQQRAGLRQSIEDACFAAHTGVNAVAGCGLQGVAQKLGHRLDARSAAFGQDGPFVVGGRSDEAKTEAVKVLRLKSDNRRFFLSLGDKRGSIRSEYDDRVCKRFTAG